MEQSRRGNRGGGRNYRGRSRGSADRYVVRPSYVGPHTGNASPVTDHGTPASGSRNSETPSIDDATKQMNKLSTSDFKHGATSTSHGARNALPGVINYNQVHGYKVSIDEVSTPNSTDSQFVTGLRYHHDTRLSSSQSESKSKNRLKDQVPDAEHTPILGVTLEKTDCEVPQKFQNVMSDSGSSVRDVDSENTDCQQMGFSFDICLPRTAGVVKLKAPLFVANKAKRSEMKLRKEGGNIKELRPGMILLKGYLSFVDQVKFTKSCRALGLGRGGFYQPGYRDGAKLHLRMMCLGKNWDPETSSYGDERPVDGTRPPPIPDEFQQFVKEALKESHSYLESSYKGKDPSQIVPLMSPSICIINFYAQTGKLGLHQDKDESQESLRQELPVVSLSIGDSAEFMYGDQRDIERADRVVLESGDVLIFGGKSRHIFHGVSNIIPNTAPKALLDQTDLRSGRLNLTFRQY